MPKRALIVDDSRSARVILGRMLEGYGLLVDSSESAEQGLEYLRQSRPDVIFMDHLMPGMDGFQAVQAIKGNPNTATIPVVMYTSQEGDLYLSQARALGAVGVLPKTVKQADVSKVLYQLRLLPERRESRATPAANDDVGPSVRIDAPSRPTPGELEAAIRSATGPLLHEHASELRRFIVASLDSFVRRMAAEDAKPAAPNSEPELLVPTEPVNSATGRWPLLAAIATLALLPSLVLAVLYTRTIESTQEVMRSNARLAAVIEDQHAQLISMRHALAQPNTGGLTAAQSASSNLIEAEPVAYGEAPLAGARLDRLRSLIAELQANGFKGTVKVTTYVGEFCLTGNGIEGYSLAADDLPFRRCDVVGNPFDEGMSTAQRQSLAFANMVSSLRGESSDTLSVEVQHLGRRAAIPYPNGDDPKLTAGDWNKVAAQNNRVEFSTESST
jgi:CheY-like chemotaxis protein